MTRISHQRWRQRLAGLADPVPWTDLESGSFSAARLGLTYIRSPASLSIKHGFKPGSGSTGDEHELTLTGEIRF